GRDRVARARDRGHGEQTRRKRCDRDVRRRTSSQAPQCPQQTDVVDAPVGPVQHEGRRLATYEDGSNGNLRDSISRKLPEITRLRVGKSPFWLWYGPAVLAAPWRPLGIAATGAMLLLLPASALAAPSPNEQALRAQMSSIEHQKRSAILSLYSLDSRLAAAYDRLAALRRSERTLRAQRAMLATELRLARLNARLSQRELAARVRALYDHGTTSTLEVIFGASSLSDAVTELDNLDRVTSVDHHTLLQVHASSRSTARPWGRATRPGPVTCSPVRSWPRERRVGRRRSATRAPRRAALPACGPSGRPTSTASARRPPSTRSSSPGSRRKPRLR